MDGSDASLIIMRPDQKKKFRNKIILSYCMDLLVVAILFIPSVLAPWIKPFQRPIDLNDPSIAFPYAKPDTFPSWSLPLVCFGIPVAVVIIRMAAEKFKRPQLVLAILGALISIALTDFITNVTKNMAGRLRPDFLARCIPEVTEAGKVICKQMNKYFVEEGRRSFPSGHASTSFAGLSFMALFLAGQLKIYDGKAKALKLTICALPVILASIVAISRVLDYRHHWHDVAVGGTLGLLITLIVYPLYFPSVFSLEADQIYTTRIDRIRSEILENAPSDDAACPPQTV